MRWSDRLLMHAGRRAFKHYMHLAPVAELPPMKAPETPVPLYLHIPFCESLCPFCTFHRVPYQSSLAANYFAALQREIAFAEKRGFRFSELYIGGGTPTVEAQRLADLITGIQQRHRLSVVSVETNPNHLVNERLLPLIDAGVSRLSVGVQSLDDQLLKMLGRYDAYGDSATICKRLGDTRGRFKTFNVDMIFNLPGQSIDSLNRDVQHLKAARVDQISWYPLMPSLSTTDGASSDFTSESDRFFEHERKQYYHLRERLLEDFSMGSVWCFQRSAGAIDEYVVGNTDYLGLGSGAFSYLDGVLWANMFSVRRYCQESFEQKPGTVAGRQLGRWAQVGYQLLMTLFSGDLTQSELRRLADVMPGKDVMGGKDAMGGKIVHGILSLLRLTGSLEKETGCWRLTPAGQYQWLILMREFFMGVNVFRSQLRRQARLTGQRRIPLKDLS